MIPSLAWKYRVITYSTTIAELGKLSPGRFGEEAPGMPADLVIDFGFSIGSTYTYLAATGSVPASISLRTLVWPGLVRFPVRANW